MEAHLIAWFAAHPFTHTLVVAMLGGVSPMIAVDWAYFQAHKVGTPDATWSLIVALKRYAQGAILGGGPIIAGEIYHILGVGQ